MKLRRHRRPGAARSRGAALIILMALLAMGVFYFLMQELEGLSLYQRAAKGESASLAQAREALLAYATKYRDDHAAEVFGYLPCPDTDGDGDAEANCGNGNEAAVGLLPYRTLGLPDLRDDSGACLWYAVSGSFKNNPKSTTSRLNWDAQGQFRVVDSSGTSLIAPDDSQGGAAAVIFAVGAALSGQNRSVSSSGPCGVDPTQVAAYLDGAYSFGTSSTISLTQGGARDGSGTTTNNDRLVWISSRDIFDRVVKRQDFSNALTTSPPGQVNTLIDRLAKGIETRLQNDIFGGTATSVPLNTASYTPQPTGAAMGDVDPATDVSLPLPAPVYDNYLTNWADQFRLIRCNSLGAPCLDVNGGGTANCRAALVFGGRTASGQPRPSAQKTPSIANLAYYFESGLNLLASAGAFTGTTTFSAGNTSLDNASCLGYGTYVSQQGDAAAFASGTVASGGGGSPVAQVTGGASPEIVLGSTTAAARAGCVWYPTPLTVDSSLRLYFTYRIDAATTGTTARGYTLTLADAITNSPYLSDPLMCGAAGSLRLGYAGSPISGTATVGGATAYLTGLSWVPSTQWATLTTSAAHGFNVGDTVTVAGVSPGGYNGTFSILSVPSTTRFSYSIAFPGPPRAGIALPKLGVEFDTYTDASRNDPSANHFAALYWGSVGDSSLDAQSLSRDGADDNYHGVGVAADGSQPLNPRSLTTTSATATPIATIAAARWSSATGTATLTTSAPHGIANGQRVVISDASALGYKGTYLATVPDSTHITYSLASSPGAYPFVATIAAATWSSGLATITTSAAHGLSTGYSVAISSAAPTGWNGTYVVTVIDDTHFSYALATNPGAWTSGGQVSHPLSWINTASWSGGIVTITTAGSHKLTTNQYATMSGIYPSAYNGTYRVTVIDDTHFSYALSNPATNPGFYVSGGTVAMAGMTSTVMAASATNIASAFWSSGGTGLAVITTAAAHGLTSGQTVHVGGVTSAGPATYNGTHMVTVFSTTSFYYIHATDPGAYVAGGVAAIAAPAVATINSATWSSASGGTATVGTAAAHGLATGQLVAIAGVSPTGYNGTYTINVVDATHFSFALASDPAGSFDATSFATPGIATVKSSDPYLPYGGSMPKDTDIHVRVDLKRGYDTSRRQATITMRTYAGDTFALEGNCSQTDFKNFARDLAELCPLRTPTFEQNGIVVNDLAGPALGKIYFGFTTGRSASAGDNETIIIRNLILRTQ